jgi:hypothetical protein
MVYNRKIARNCWLIRGILGVLGPARGTQLVSTGLRKLTCTAWVKCFEFSTGQHRHKFPKLPPISRNYVTGNGCSN